MTTQPFTVAEPPAYDFAHAADNAWKRELDQSSWRLMSGAPLVSVEARDDEATRYALDLQRAFGTQGSSTLVDPSATLLSLRYVLPEYSLIPGVSVSFHPLTVPARRLTPTQEAVTEIRRLSGLSVRLLVTLFPVQYGEAWRPISEKGFYRWLSGEVAASEGNLQRLVSIRAFLQVISGRVSDVRSWLLTPARSGEVPLNVLRAGRLTHAMELANDLTFNAGRRVYDADGTPGLQITDLPFDDRGNKEDYLPDTADDWDDE